MHDPRVVTKKSGIEGKGYFASAPIKEGEALFRWKGKVVTDQDLKQIEDEGKYHSSVALGEDRNLLFNIVDPRATKEKINTGSGTGGLNHSCNPNLWMQNAVTICARRDIQVGEELTIDYAMFTVAPDWKLNNCQCGTPSCRHIITGNDWKLPDLQKRYKNHFSPFINERIRIDK